MTVCRPPLRYQEPSSEDVLGFVSEEDLVVRDQKMLDPATSHTSASARHFSDPSEESFHSEDVHTLLI